MSVVAIELMGNSGTARPTAGIRRDQGNKKLAEGS